MQPVVFLDGTARQRPVFQRFDVIGAGFFAG
jgi:hypothetical protein